MNLGDTPLILGREWLREADPDIRWKDFSIQYRDPQEDQIQGKQSSETIDIPEEFRKYESLFEEEGFSRIPDHRNHDCAIDFKEGTELPKPAKTYGMSPAESKALQEYLDKELADGKIRPSKSPIASPCFYVNKADGGLRLVVDYRKLNEITKSDQFPMPLQSDLLEKLKDAKIFTKMDIRWGFNNIRIKEGDEWKTAFRTKEGLFEYLVMPFGVKNGPATFQRFMNEIFHDLIDICVVVYMDDILIYSANREEHTAHVLEVLKRLKENNLFLKPHKCNFYTTTTSFIGIVVTPEGISMEKEKIKAIEEWKEPTKIKELQSFLGFANFYRRFVRDFSTIAKPLTSLTRKDRKWSWGEEESRAFNQIKTEISRDPVLSHPDPKKPYFLETDASGVAMGSILSQRKEDGYLHPIAFLSESFNDAQRNYDTHDKELLAIIRSLEHWHLFLEGTDEPITVYTDHRNLQFWQQSQNWNRRHARWHGILASFNFNIVYRPGKLSNKPDALSRRHDHADIPNPAQVMIEAEKFKGFRAEATIDIISEIKEAQQEDESLATLMASTQKKDELPPSVKKQFNRYTWEGDLLWYDGRIIVPEDKDIRLRLLEQDHDSPIAGHQGQARTLEVISRRYYWPGMKA